MIQEEKIRAIQKHARDCLEINKNLEVETLQYEVDLQTKIALLQDEHLKNPYALVKHPYVTFKKYMK